MSAPTPLLSVENLTMRFGGLTAVDGLSFTAEARKITAIIGPNGAGKSTLFNCLTGFHPPSKGRIELNRPGHRPLFLERMEASRIARDAKVTRTFQNIRLFTKMTVLENLMVAQHNLLMRASFYSLAGLMGLARYQNAEKAALEKARYWLDKAGLDNCGDIPAGHLPYGAQRRLEVVRAMCVNPLLLCLDEPAAGLNPRESLELVALIALIRDQHGAGVLLIEHDMSVVMKISDHIIVLDHGQKIAEGPPASVRRDAAVIRAYLGAEEDLELPLEVIKDIGSDQGRKHDA